MAQIFSESRILYALWYWGLDIYYAVYALALSSVRACSGKLQEAWHWAVEGYGGCRSIVEPWKIRFGSPLGAMKDYPAIAAFAQLLN